LRRTLIAHARKPVEELLGALVAESAAFFSSMPREDDVTLVVAELGG
jgi:serine phosphatase RsbU (regulator of sigma subunit)